MKWRNDHMVSLSIAQVSLILLNRLESGQLSMTEWATLTDTDISHIDSNYLWCHFITLPFVF